jgi:16S rRNA (cytidine1402-2'-O)-methyltransferase
MQSNETTGKLYLIPTIISDDTQTLVLPPGLLQTLPRINHFLVENVRTARRYLSSLKVYPSIEPLHFEVLDKDTPWEAMRELFAPVLSGNDMGILSESGCPGVADPGALAVSFAHSQGIPVVPLVGPSSILLALMASGLNGQRFAFHGYLPVQEGALVSAIRELERESSKKNQTQIFIETPYRNNRLMAAMLKVLRPDTELCVALDLTGTAEKIRTAKVNAWKAERIDFPKLPSVFLFLAK